MGQKGSQCATTILRCFEIIVVGDCKSREDEVLQSMGAPNPENKFNDTAGYFCLRQSSNEKLGHKKRSSAPLTREIAYV